MLKKDFKKEAEYKLLSSFKKDEIIGMYMIALKREQEKDEEIKKLKNLNKDLFDLSEMALNDLSASKSMAITNLRLIESYKKKITFLKATQSPESDKDRLKTLLDELHGIRNDLKNLSTKNKNKKKELKAVEKQMSLFRVRGFSETANLLDNHVLKIHKELIYSAGIITKKIKRVKELKILISELHTKKQFGNVPF